MATVPPQHQKVLAARKAPSGAVRRSTSAVEAQDDFKLPSWRKLAADGEVTRASERGKEAAPAARAAKVAKRDATVARPALDAVAKPVAEQVAKPVADAAGKPVAKETATPAAEEVEKPVAKAVAKPAAKAAAELKPPAPDIGKEKHDEERSSAAQAARASGAAEGTALAASPAQRKEDAAKEAQRAREGRIPTAADREIEETAETKGERAQKTARVAARVAAEPAPEPTVFVPEPVKTMPVVRPPAAAASAAPAPTPVPEASSMAVKNSPVSRRSRGPPDAPDRALATAETSAGHPLPDVVVQAFADAWGEDFSSVRIHSDASAALASDLLAAEAFTLGEDLYFAAGRFALQTEAGRALLAHELAHVVQLRNGDLRGLRGVSHSGSPTEAAADALVARRGIPTFVHRQPGAAPASHDAPLHDRDAPRGAPARAPPSAGVSPGMGPSVVLRRATDQTKTFFDQGYFQQANAWSSATTALDAELSTDAAADTATFPSPTASLGPEQAPEPPAVAPAPALTLEGEIPIPAEAEALAVTEDEFAADAPSLPSLGHLSAGAEGDTSAAEAQLDNALDDVPTDFDVATSPGERPPVSLEGGADPSQTEEQELVAHDQAEALRVQAAEAVEQGPGPEQVQPTSYHETLSVPEGEAGTLEPLDEIPEMAALQADPIPEEVRAATDAAGQEQLQASLAEADAALDTAAADHDAQREQEVERAQVEQQRLDTEATRAQDAEVQRARGEIDGHRADAIEQQNAAVGELDTQAAEERALVQGDIDAQVESDTQAIEDRYTQAEAEAQAEKDRKEAEARAEKEEAERKSEDQSWWESALDAIASFFDALLEAVNAIFDALIEAVGTIIEKAKAAVTAIIDAARDFAVGLVQAFGELLKGLVQDLLGSIFPELAAALTQLIDDAVNAAVEAINWIADQLEAGLHALLDSIGSAITALLEAYRAAINAAIAIARAALTGDWAALARMVLEAALTLAGIPPESFYAVLNNAMAALDTILADPGAFVGNVINAVAAGFQAFADNFLAHLQEGFFAWIVGPLGELGITLPATWDIGGIFSLVMQVLGLTREGIRLVITEELGETAGAIFEFVWRYVGALIDGGLEGLWTEIQNDLGMLWNIVVDGIKNWLLETIVVQAVIKVATMFNPVGALVQALITVWNVYQWLRENAQRIFGIVQAIVDMIASIASGNIQPAALAVEGALASLIPIAISLLANLLGLGGMTDKVREVLESVRATVRDAIRSLIRRVKALFAGGDGPAGEEEGAAGDVTGQTTMSGESHTLTIDVDGRSVTLASDGGDIAGQVGTAFANIEALEAADPARGQRARQILQSIQSAVASATSTLAAGVPAEQQEAVQGQLRGISDQMLRLLTEYGDVTGVHALAEPIKVFQPPVLGNHTVSEPGPVPPDGTTRESHHVPANELAQTLSRTFSEEADRLEGDEPAASAALLRHVPASLSADGGGLSAILIHVQTHRLGGAAVHSSSLRPLIERELTRIRSAAETERQQPLDAASAAVAGAAATLTVRIGSGAVAVNPRSGHWQRFIADARRNAQQIRADALSQGADPAAVVQEVAVVDAAVNTAEALCATSENTEHQQAVSGAAEEARLFAQVAFTGALQQSSAAVVAALQSSVVDGSKDRHPSAGALQANADSNLLWRRIVFGT